MISGRRQEIIGAEEMDRIIASAARAGGYEEGFGVTGCDLSRKDWWAAYARQSLEEQAQNNRLSDYLRTCAQEARKLGVIVPREYVLYDAVTGEHLERPNMIYLRELMQGRRISGVVFPALDRLSREPLHQQIFEMEAAHYGIRLHYADAPSGDDPGSQFARTILTHAAKLVRLKTHGNARGGNIGRIVKGSVPAHVAPYGYRYAADREIGSDGRVLVKKAWWEVDELGPKGEHVWRSPAWVAQQIFRWVGDEGRTLYWVVKKLNGMRIPAPSGGKWYPGAVSRIVRRPCYSGEHLYNANARVGNPERPLGDITAEVKRTVLRPKPEGEWVRYPVPELVSNDLAQRAVEAVTKRGRGRGKEGKSIEALLRGRIYCPQCGRPMLVKRAGKERRVYYHCSRYFRPWAPDPCSFTRFVPGTLDEVIWGDMCILLKDDSWVEKQVVSELSRDENVGKLIRLQQHRISQARAKMAKVQRGYEGELYSLEEARDRVKALQEVISESQAEIRRLESRLTQGQSEAQVERLVEQLKAMRDRNLEDATFAEKLELVSLLGIQIHPSEDLKSVRVVCSLNLMRQERGANPGVQLPVKPTDYGEHESRCGKVAHGGADGIRTRDPLLAKQVLSRLSYSPTGSLLDERIH